MKHALFFLIACAAFAGDPPVEPQRALVITLKWEGDTIAVDKVDKREVALPGQKGFAQLLKVFYELRDANGDVHYSGGLKDPRLIPHSTETKESGTSTLTVPDIEEARKLVILERIGKDPDKGRRTVMEADL
jgi:hypothetical protein